jgi:predicted ABC-type ATPase
MSSRNREAARFAASVAGEDRVLVVVAGPNGAGKTTFVEMFLGAVNLRVVNADAIARALSPTPEAVAYEAARLADGVRRDLLSRDVSFCMETVFSDREGAKLELLREAQSRGYVVVLTFIGLHSSELATARVVERVEQGGHDVPDAKIAERFPRTLRNLEEALTFVDRAFIFDNSSAEAPYRFVAELKSARVVRRGETQPRWWREVRRTSR